MVAWFIVSAVLLVWNVIYCTRKVVADFRGLKPANGVWGVFAVAGAASAITMIVFAVLVAGSGI